MDLAPRSAADLDRIIRRGLATFVEVGEALAELKERRGYLELGFRSFGDYCQALGLHRSYAYRLMDSARVATLLSPIGDTPTHEAQARELAPLLKEGPAEVQAAWQRAREVSQGVPTAETVREVVQAHRRPRPAVRLVETTGQGAGPGVTLYRGDCCELLPTLPPASVQLVVTSPEYNVPWDYGDGHPPRPRPLDEYLAQLTQVLAHLYRVLRPGGVLALNLPPTIRVEGQHRAYPLGGWAETHLADTGWLIREIVPWVKTYDGTPFASTTAWGAATNPYLRPTHERIILASKGVPEIAGHTWADEVSMEWLKDTWLLPPGRAAWPGGPLAFPDDLVTRLVLLYSRPGDVVLDPFAGSGTVARVARAQGRAAWLIELRPAYWPHLEALVEAA